MTIGLFTDKSHAPALREIKRALGAKYPLWNQLTKFIGATYAITGEPIFGGKNYGWNVRYRRGGRTLTSLFPQTGYFVALVTIGPSEMDAVRALPLGPKTKAVLDRATTYPEGRWLYIPVRTARDLKDVQRLLAVKRRPPAHAATANAAPDGSEFDAVFRQLKAIMQKYETSLLKASTDGHTDYSLSGPVTTASRGRPIWFGGVRKGKAYVSYHLMPVYARPDLLEGMSPELRKHMQGKSCFNFRHSEPALFKELAKLTKRGYEGFRKAGLIG